MAAPAYTYTLTNGATADASQVMQNFNDVLNGITDGTKDLSINALTVAGVATFNGNVTLGNASSDDVTVTGSLASSIPVKTTASYNVGDSTHGLLSLYLGRNSQTVRVIASASMSSTWTLTLPPTTGSAGDILQTTDTSGTTGWSSSFAGVKTFQDGIVVSSASNQGTLSYFRTGSFTSAVTGAITPSDITIQFERIGRFVIVRLPQTFATAGSASTISLSGSNVPSELRPTNNQHFLIAVKDNGNYKTGTVSITTSGAWTVAVQGTSTSLTANFAGSGSTGFEQTNLCYMKD